MRIEKSGTPIQTVDDWKKLAPPAHEIHWKPGRSALESANAWCLNGPCVPNEIAALLASNADTASCSITAAEPEALIAFDQFSGPRHADMAIAATDARGPIAITIEAKADETFDRVVSDILAEVDAKIAKDERTNAGARIDGLMHALFGSSIEQEPSLAALRYQLLTATAGTLAYAAQLHADRAVLIVHEFTSSETTQDRQAVNKRDLDAFVRRVTNGAVTELRDGVLVGPISVPGGGRFPRPAALYIGKATRDVRSLA